MTFAWNKAILPVIILYACARPTERRLLICFTCRYDNNSTKDIFHIEQDTLILLFTFLIMVCFIQLQNVCLPSITATRFFWQIQQRGTKQTPWRKMSSLRRGQVTQSEHSWSSMTDRGSLPCSQTPDTGPYLKPHESILHSITDTF